MSNKTIDIGATSAVMYCGTAPVEAHAGSPESIRAWVLKQCDENNIPSNAVRGWHNIKPTKGAASNGQTILHR
jgi:hypothetical protein